MTENDVVIEILKRIQAELSAHSRAFDVLQQDTRAIRSTVTGHTRVIDTLQHDVRMVRAALNDFDATHADLNRVQRDIAELIGRVEALEERTAPPPPGV
jgi:hypothetical protein